MKRNIIAIIALCGLIATIEAKQFGNTIHFEYNSARNKSAIEAFDQAINDAEIVVVDFFATWCGPCKTLGPCIDALAKELNTVKFMKVDVDKHATLASKYNIKSMPTLKFFKNGVEKKTLVGNQSKTVIKKTIDELS
jgi:thioredoxin 1